MDGMPMRPQPITFESLSSLIGRIYDAALDYEAMTGAIKELSEILNAPYLAVGLWPAKDDIIGNWSPAQFVWNIGFDQTTLAKAYERYTTEETNPFLRQLRRQPVNKPFQTYDVLERRDFLRHPMYNEVYRPCDIEPGLTTTIFRDCDAMGILSAYRTKLQDFFSEPETELIRLLMPHLARALQLRRRLVLVEQNRAAAENILGRLPQGVILLDARRRVIFLNQTAEAVLENNNELVITERGLTARTLVNDRKLQHLIRRAINPVEDGDQVDQAFSFELTRNGAALHMVILPLQVGDLIVGLRQPCAAIFLSEGRPPIKLSLRILQDLYGLTAAEAKIANLIVNGISISEAAKRLRVSRNTAATHVRLVFEKTGCHRQSDLARHILVGPAVICLENNL
jgi:DNA-binding CsgD family transcriptional regulator/PAS domain-containing protein